MGRFKKFTLKIHGIDRDVFTYKDAEKMKRQLLDVDENIMKIFNNDEKKTYFHEKS